MTRRVFLLCLLSSCIYGQVTPTGRFFEKSNIVSCEELLARADAFGMELSKDTSAMGFVVISGGGAESRVADKYAKFVHLSLLGRFAANLHVTVLRNRKGTVASEFYVVPAGSSADSTPAGEAVAEIPFRIKVGRQLFATQTENPCDNHLFNALVNTLNANPELIGLVVDVNVPRLDRRSSLRHWRESFGERQIPRERYRVVFRRSSNSGLRESYTEYWLVLKK